jgi:predicted ArsR family transcriptional regulator
VLEAVAEARGLTCVEAAAKFGVSAPAMRNRLQGLVADGALTKGGDKKFRRVVALVRAPEAN